MIEVNMSYRIQQFIILIAHLILLYWIISLLQTAGEQTRLSVFLHFLGMGSYGAFLIRGTAYWAFWHYQKNKI